MSHLPQPAHAPLISVVVLNYRRREELARTLDSVRAQSWPARELIVVDNHSQDDTVDFLARHFPEAKVLALTENVGCGGRNRGVAAARGEFVVTLDNDVRFESPRELDHLAAAFERLPQASVLVFKILHDPSGRLHLRDWCHPRSHRQFSETSFETCYIAEGACAFRRQHFLSVQGYWEPFLIGGEGWDLALRLLDAGYRIFYCPEVCVRHAMAEETRGERRPFYRLMRNYVWTAFKDYPGWRRFQYMVYGLTVLTFYAARSGNLAELFRGLADGLQSRHQIPLTRISHTGWQRVRELRAQRPSWLMRLRTRWAQSEP